MKLTRRRVVLAVSLVLLGVLVPVIVLGVGRFPAFDIFGQDDPLGVENGRQDMVVCFRSGLSRFQPDDVVNEVLTIPQPDGSEALPPGVDGFAFDSAGEGSSATTVLLIDFYSNASEEEQDAVQVALLGREEVLTVVRDARASDCRAATSTTS